MAKTNYEQMSKDIIVTWETKKNEFFAQLKQTLAKPGKIIKRTTVPVIGTSYEAVCPMCNSVTADTSRYSSVPSWVTCAKCGTKYSLNENLYTTYLCAFKHGDDIVLLKEEVDIEALHEPDGTFKDFNVFKNATRGFAVITANNMVKFDQFQGSNEYVKTTKKLMSYLVPRYGSYDCIFLDGITEIYGIPKASLLKMGYHETNRIEEAIVAAKPAKTKKTAKVTGPVTFAYDELGAESLTEFLISVNSINELTNEVKAQAWCPCGHIWEETVKSYEQENRWGKYYKFTCPNCGKEHILEQCEITHPQINTSVVQISDNDVLNSWDLVFVQYTIDTEWNVTPQPRLAARVYKANGKIERYINNTYSGTVDWHKTQRQERYSSYAKIFFPDSLKYSGITEMWDTVREGYFRSSPFIGIPKYIALWNSNPVVEQVTKRNSKLANLLWGYCSGNNNSEVTTINLEGKTTSEFFGISERLMKIFCKEDININMFSLQALYRDDPDISEDAVRWICKNSVNVPDVIKLHGYGIPISDCTAYLERVRKVQYVEPYTAIREWSDYLTACEVIGTDLNDKTVKYPRHLLSEHNIVINKRKLITDVNKDEAFRTRCDIYSKLFSYKDKDIIVKAPDSVQELLEEGRKLHHCIGSYADKIIEGSSLIFFIRRASEPDKPWLTIDLNEAGQVIELRGDLDRVPSNADKKKLIPWLKKKNISGGKWVSVA